MTDRVMNDLHVLILERAVAKGIWGKKSLYVNNLIGGIPSDRKGDAKTAVDELLKEGLFLSKPHHHGLKVFLNANKRAEIERIVKQETQFER